MNPTTNNNAKDFFLNLGATISLYTVVGSLIALLFTVINTAYPRITDAYYYGGSSSISWPVAVLVIFTPILIVLMRMLGKQYTSPESSSTMHKWLSYLTLFVAGLVVAGDLITILYYFIDGQELSMAFLLKALVLFVVSGAIFGYYLTDIRGKLNPKIRNLWRIFAVVLVLGSIVLGFAVMGSPATQRLYKYDDVKVNDLMNITNSVQSYYYSKGVLPKTLSELSSSSYYFNPTDSQTGVAYEYAVKNSTTFEVCAVFNKSFDERTGNRTTSVAYPAYGGMSWTHPAGRHCFEQTVTVDRSLTKPVM